MSAPKQGRIEEGGAGIGVPTPEQVEQRASELAKIAGRTRVNEADRDAAHRELTGEISRFHSEEDAFTSWANRPDATGHRVDTESPEEEAIDRPVGEELAVEGVGEALHDEMLEAREEEAQENGESGESTEEEG